ncbi:MAG: hypothetical protein QXI58_02720 [Candidatus Micrarchaeia archaeon]
MTNLSPTGYLIDVILLVLRETFAVSKEYTYSDNKDETKIIITTSYPAMHEKEEKRPRIIIDDPVERGFYPRYNMGAELRMPEFLYHRIIDFGQLTFSENETIYQKNPDDPDFTEIGIEVNKTYFIIVYFDEVKAGKVKEVSQNEIKVDGNLSNDLNEIKEIFLVNPQKVIFHYGDLFIYNCSILCQSYLKREADNLSFMVADILRRRRDDFLAYGLTFLTNVMRTGIQYNADLGLYHKQVLFQAGLPYFWIIYQKGGLLTKILPTIKLGG